jgi:hypothetical protein
MRSTVAKAIEVTLTTLLWFLVTYWAIFIGYTVEKLATGGPQAALAWYSHVSSKLRLVPWGDTFLLQEEPWHAKAFFLQEATLLALTVGIWLFRKRLLNRSRPPLDPPRGA